LTLTTHNLTSCFSHSLTTHKPSFKRSMYRLYNSCAAAMKPKITDFVSCDQFSLTKR